MVANAASISLKSFFFSAAGAQLVDNRIFSLATSATKRAVEFFCAPTLLWWSKFWIYSHRLSLIHGIFRCCDRLRLSKCATVATRSDHLSPNRFHSFNKKNKKKEKNVTVAKGKESDCYQLVRWAFQGKSFPSRSVAAICAASNGPLCAPLRTLEPARNERDNTWPQPDTTISLTRPLGRPFTSFE